MKHGPVVGIFWGFVTTGENRYRAVGMTSFRMMGNVNPEIPRSFFVKVNDMYAA
jgi:hypothetical protein